MSESVRVFRWDEFRLMRPIPEDTKEFAAMLMARNLGFSFQDDPALYVRKMMDRLSKGDGVICTGEDEPDGQLCRVDWHGFVDSVRNYLGDTEAARAVAVLAKLTGDPDLND